MQAYGTPVRCDTGQLLALAFILVTFVGALVAALVSSFARCVTAGAAGLSGGARALWERGSDSRGAVRTDSLTRAKNALAQAAGIAAVRLEEPRGTVPIEIPQQFLRNRISVGEFIEH